MKTILKTLGLVLLTSFVFSACSKNTDPADRDLFVGTYKGSISYNDGGATNISDADGNVRVVKVGNKYNFIFGTSIPDITGVEFNKEDENTHINIGGDATNYIRINASTLKILYLKDGKTWTADCTR